MNRDDANSLLINNILGLLDVRKHAIKELTVFDINNLSNLFRDRLLDLRIQVEGECNAQK